MIAQAIRSALFYFLFIGQTILLAVPVGIIALLTGGRIPGGWPIARYWARSNLFFLRWVAGIRTEVRGREHLPEGGCIIAAKHQSDWDIIALVPWLADPAFIAKRELLDIPLFGPAVRGFNTISVDRKKGAEAVPAMLEEAQAALARGCRIIIYPEGTRRAPLADPAYRSGVVRMYEALNVPVVPMAVNSGFFWGRNSPILWPGKAVAQLLPPIPPGLDGKVFHERLISEIETASNALALEAAEAGLSRPITPDMRERLNRIGFK